MNNLRKLIVERAKKLRFRPDENLGQHFLTDESVIEILVESVGTNDIVIEVGAGLGQLTEALAKKAKKVISIEIDKRCQPVLNQAARRNRNVKIIYGDVLAMNFKDLFPRFEQSLGIKMVSSLPFHISEPLLHKLALSPINSATLVVGRKLVASTCAVNEESSSFGQLTIFAKTFFDIQVLALVDKSKFFPSPRANAAVIKLTPKSEDFFLNKRNFVLRRLLTPLPRNPLVKNAVKEGLIKYDRIIRQKLLTQNQAQKIIEETNIPDEVLKKTFQQLNNKELRILSIGLDKM